MDWSNLTEKDLMEIKRARSINQLAVSIRIPPKVLKKEARKVGHKKYKVPKDYFGMSQAFYATLTDVPTYPLIILWSILGLTSMGTLPLIMTVVGLLGASIIAGAVFFYASWKEHVTEAGDKQEEFELSILKIEALNVLIARIHAKQGCKLDEDAASHFTTIPPAAPKNHTHVKQAVKATMLVATTIFSTFYFGTNALIAEFGIINIATAMLSPVGLAIALGVSLAIGVYFGYTQYKASKNIEAIKNVNQSALESVTLKVSFAKNLNSELAKKLSLETENDPESDKDEQLQALTTFVARNAGRPSIFNSPVTQPSAHASTAAPHSAPPAPKPKR